MFYSYKTHIDEQERLRISRAQLTVMSSFAQNFASLDIPNMLQTSARLALTGRSQTGSFPINENQFVDIMQDGAAGGTTYFPPTYGTDEQLARVISTVPFAQNIQFTYRLTSVQQTAPDTFLLRFSVTYLVQANDVSWMETDREYEVQVTAYSVKHPTYNAIIDETWVETTGCLAELLFTITPSCSGNLKPNIPENI